MYSVILSVLIFSVALCRVPVEERTYSSEAVDTFISRVKDQFIDPELGKLFESCYPNTLDTTVYAFKDTPEGDEDTFLITGDITAMWLRDSTNQVGFEFSAF